MSDKAELQATPVVPEGILKAAKAGELVIFVGAGASKPTMPGWDEWVDDLLTKLIRHGAINHSDKHQIKSLDVKKQVSIVKIIADSDTALKSKLKIGETFNTKGKDVPRIYNSLNRIGCNYITTNYDDFLKPYKDIPPIAWTEDKRHYDLSDLKEGHFVELCHVLHLHGIWHQEKNMIVSDFDYFRHYAPDSPVPNFLRRIFKTYTVLFIGYSLGEPEILAHFFPSMDIDGNLRKQHYMLDGFYRSQTTLYNFLRDYYQNTYKIELIGFPLDEKSYERLTDIIDDWSINIESKSQKKIGVAQRIEEEANSELTSHELENLFTAAHQNKHTFKLLMKRAEKIAWLQLFINKDVFQIDANFSRYWAPVSYLHNIKDELSKPENADDAEKVWQIIKDVTSHARENSIANYHVWWKFVQITPNIPSEMIKEEELKNLVAYWLESSLGAAHMILADLGDYLLVSLLKNDDEHSKKLLLELLSQMYAIEEIKDSNTATGSKAIFKVKDQRNYHIKKITETYANNIGRSIGINAAVLLRELLTEAVSMSDNDSWCSYWQPAIENHKQNEYREDCENILVMCLRDILSGYIEVETLEDNIVPFVQELLNSEFLILKRIGIYAVAEHYSRLKALTDSVLELGIPQSGYRHEYWQFLHRNVGGFNPDQKKLVLSEIENITHDKDEEPDEKYLAYKKAIWYSALKDIDIVASEKYQECLSTGISDPEHPDFGCYSSGVKRVSPQSPYSIEYLGEMDIPNLVKTLQDYDGPISSWGDEPDLEGLCKALKETIKTQPEKYIDRLEQWLDMAPYYIYELLSAYHFLWIDRYEKLPWKNAWDKILHFCDILVEKSEFWSYEPNDNDRWFTRNYVPGTIAQLIESGIREDERTFDISCIPLAKNIILKMLNESKPGDYERDSFDPLGVAINSQRGKCLECLINLALHSCKLEDKKNKSHEDVWKNEYQSIFENEFDIVQKNEAFDFAPLATRYLPQFLYMSKTWVSKRLEHFFPEGNEIAWKAAIHGYSCVGQVHQSIYKYLKDTGQLEKVLDIEEFKEVVKERIIQQSVIVYLNENEKLTDENSLLKKILERKKYDELHQAIWFLWAQRSKNEKENTELRNKVFEIWRAILDIITPELETKEEYKKLASELCQLAVFIDELNEECIKLLKSICKYAEIAWHSDQVIESFTNLVGNYTEQVFDLYMKMLEGPPPYYPKEKIVSVLKKFDTEKQTQILDKYVDQGESNLALELRKAINMKEN
jgi:hypothetical protein